MKVQFPNVGYRATGSRHYHMQRQQSQSRNFLLPSGKRCRYQAVVMINASFYSPLQYFFLLRDLVSFYQIYDIGIKVLMIEERCHIWWTIFLGGNHFLQAWLVANLFFIVMVFLGNLSSTGLVCVLWLDLQFSLIFFWNLHWIIWIVSPPMESDKNPFSFSCFGVYVTKK